MHRRAAAIAIGLFPSANVLLRAAPAFPLYFAARNNPSTIAALVGASKNFVRE
jgi:hypothetical protein